jgi:iron complex outermembrane receptor protein
MHRLSLLVLALCFSTFSLAQTTFKAQILEEASGNPLVGATLYFPQLELGGTSD